MSDNNATVPVTGIMLADTSLSLLVEDTKSLTATVTPENATNKKVIWTSSNPAVVKVTAAGSLTAISAGRGKITATASGGEGGRRIASTIFVTVSEAVNSEPQVAESESDEDKVPANSGVINSGQVRAQNSGVTAQAAKPKRKEYSYKMKPAKTLNKARLYDPGSRITIDPNQARIMLCDNAWTDEFVELGIFVWLEDDTGEK